MVTLRPAAPSDAEGIFRLACMLSERFQVDRGPFMATFSLLQSDADMRLAVAVQGDEIIGYILGWLGLAFYSNGPVGWVQEIVVDPARRRHGVGRQLMGDFEDWIATRGGRFVSLATRGAPEFYRALQYQESATYYKKAIQPNKSVDPTSDSARLKWGASSEG